MPRLTISTRQPSGDPLVEHSSPSPSAGYALHLVHLVLSSTAFLAPPAAAAAAASNLPPHPQPAQARASPAQLLADASSAPRRLLAAARPAIDGAPRRVRAAGTRRPFRGAYFAGTRCAVSVSARSPCFHLRRPRRGYAQAAPPLAGPGPR
jgi:hypothetical protein